LDGGVIRISAVSEALVSGQLKAQGVAATARGTVASVQAGKGGRIEVTGQRVALTGAALDASGPAGGGTVLLGGDAHGANPAMPNTSTTTVDGASTVRADALAKGDGGTVVAYANQRTEVAGLLSVRGGPAGGNGGFVETSGASVALSRGPDLAAPLGKGGTWLIDPVDIMITSTIPDATTLKAFFTGANGAYPAAALTAADRIGLYYGTTAYGGEYGHGAIFAFDSITGSISLKGSFTDTTNGAIPFAALTAAGNGLYYGTTYGGGANGQGAIYAFDSVTGSISLKGSFTDNTDKTNGAFPSAALTAAGNGLYYGTTENGGEYGQGAIYAFDANSNSYVSTATIQSALNAGGDVIVDTTNALGSQAGNITVNSPINKTAGGAASLSLNAHNNIALNSNISSISAALNLNLNADIDANGSGATSLASGARLSLNSGTATANGPINMAANSMIKDAQIVAPAINSDGGILENNLYLNVDSLRLNGGSLQANGKAIIKALDLSAGSITGSGDLQITQSFMRTGGSIAGNFSNLAINHASGSLIPGALSAAGPVALLAKNGQLNLNAPISASTVLARGSSGITLSSAAVLTASAPLGRAITFDAGSGPFSNNSSAGPAALSKQPGATWAIYADNPTSTPRANLGGLAYNFKQYNQTFDANQGSNPVLGSGNGLFLANIPMLSVSLMPVSKVYDSKIEAILSASNYNVTGVLAGDLVAITAAGAFDNKNAGTGKLVSVKGLTIASATEIASGVAVYGYNLSSTEASGAIGTITPLPLTGAAIAPGSSIYGSVLTPGAVNFGNIVGSDEVIASAIVNTSTLSSSGKPIVGTYSQSASALTGVDAGNYSFSGFTSAQNYSISRAPLTPSFTIKDKPFDGNSVATIAGYNLQGVLAGDDVSMAKASAAFDNASVGKNKPVAIDGFPLSGSDVNNYQLSSSNATATASITARTIVPPNEESIKKNHGNPGVGLQSAKISSLSNLRPVKIDSSNVSPSASVAKASIATLSGPDLFPSTPTESAMSADSAAQGLLESDQRSAEEAIIGLDLSDAGAGEAMSAARLQQLMQSAADLIRRYPVRMLNP